MHLSNWVKLATMDKLANTVKDECIENSKYMDQQVLRCGHGDYSCILWGSAFPVLKITYQELQIGTGDVSARMLIAGARFVAGLILVFWRSCIQEVGCYTYPGFHAFVVLGLAQTGLQYFFFTMVLQILGIKAQS